MKFMKSKKWRLGAILIAAAILTVAVSGLSFAANDQTGAPDRKALCQSFITKLAANLGVDEGALTTAIETTRQEMIDEAVQNGTITQEQADRMAQMRADGICDWFGFPGGKGGHGGRGPGQILDDLAGILEMTADELKAEMDAGKKLDEIAADRGLTMEQVQEKMKETAKARIQQKVTDGKITQERADQMLQRLEQGKGFGGQGRCPWWPQ
ncbi:MAG: hypothetical protein PHP51_04955 [Desulfotomaculaceae bacterium]|nr:hypothetical protein [Desulfotomaculaceae bacterium]MDD4767885.1 hypothetical protein [Desulfotomaculaceae bacterium]